MSKKNSINISKSTVSPCTSSGRNLDLDIFSSSRWQFFQLIGLQAELARKREELTRNHRPTEKKSRKLGMKPKFQEQLKNFKEKVRPKVPDWKDEDDSEAISESK